MIRFDNVTKRYPSGQMALQNVDFELGTGEMVFLTGHSGAGKSTLLKLIMVMERATKGKVFVNGKNLLRLRQKHIPLLRRSVGMVFQDPRLLMDRTVYDNVALPLEIAGFRPGEISRRVHETLAKVSLSTKVKSLAATLSGGEMERVGIARAIVNSPSLILADEPTGNLDPSLSAEIMHVFEEINQQGIAILIATHDLALIGHLKHRIMTLHQGKMVSTGVRVRYDD